MLPFSWYMLKVIICSSILFGYYWFFLRNKIFHQYNRFYLLAAMSLSLLLPLLKIDFWQPAEQKNQAILVLQAVSAGDEYILLASQKKHWSVEQLYPIVYILVSVIFFFVMLRTLYLIRTLLKKYPVQQVEKVAFINTQDDSTPFSFLKYIFWNSNIDLNTTTGRQIFKHEVAHIQEKHTHDKLFVNTILIFCWCNPFFWLYRRELNMIHEFIADKKAVEDSDTSAFAAMILQAAYPKQRFELANNFFYSPIKRRLTMLTKNKNPKANYIGRIMVLPLAVLVFAAFSLKAKTDIKLPDRIDAQSIEFRPEVAEKTLPDMFISSDQYSITDTVPVKIVTGVNPDGKVPLYILNGKETDKTTATAIKPEDIQEVRVVKDDIAVKVYGDKGKNGVVIISTKKGDNVANKQLSADTLRMFDKTIDNAFDATDALIVVDNIEYQGKKNKDDILSSSPEGYKSITILNSEDAVKLYGEKAKNGAIVITTGASLKIVEGKLLSEQKSKHQSDSLKRLEKKIAELDYTKQQLNYLAASNDLKKSVAEKKLQEKQLNELKQKLVAEEIELAKSNYKEKQLAYLSTTKEEQQAVVERKLNEKQLADLKTNAGNEIAEKQPGVKFADASVKLFVGNYGGGRISVEELKAQKELNVNGGYSFVSASVYFTYPGDKTVRMITLNSISVSAMLDSINKCGPGCTMIFDKVLIKAGNGELKMILNPPGFTITN